MPKAAPPRRATARARLLKEEYNGIDMEVAGRAVIIASDASGDAGLALRLQVRADEPVPEIVVSVIAAPFRITGGPPRAVFIVRRRAAHRTSWITS